MYSETENAIFTLNRMSFFSDMRKYHLSYYDILHELISIYNLSSHEAKLWILKKANFYHYPNIQSKETLYQYIMKEMIQCQN